jgi:hypothetical protein
MIPFSLGPQGVPSGDTIAASMPPLPAHLKNPATGRRSP